MTNDRALSLLVYGPSKSGKSTLFLTSPGPRLFLDVESAARFLPTKKVYWNPLHDPPPQDDGTWETAIVTVNSLDAAKKALDVLKSGKHPFKSVALDSISELQAKAQESIVGRVQMKMQDWGRLLNEISFFGRDLRDLTTHHSNPLEIVYITATERVDHYEGAPDRHKPYLQGQAGSQLPYWFDVTGYLYPVSLKNAEGKLIKARNLLVSSNPNFEAGNRIPTLAEVEAIPNPNFTELLDTIFGAGA